MSKNHTGIDNYKNKVINFNERSNSSYDILIGWRIHTNFAPILLTRNVYPITQYFKASILQRITYQQRTPPLFLQREKRCHVSAANL